MAEATETGNPELPYNVHVDPSSRQTASAATRGEITRILDRLREGDSNAREQLYGLAYSELRRLAASHLRRQLPGHSLQPTDIVHEAYLRLAGGAGDRTPKDRSHFFAVAARAMRQILCDHARRKRTVKHGGEQRRLTLDDSLGLAAKPGLEPIDVLDLDRALEALNRLHERQAHIIEMRYFAGFTIDETAEALAISTATVENDTAVARVWLRRALGKR